MHSSKKILKTVLVLVICGILLKGLDTALYPCTFMRNDVHAVVTEQFDDIILGTSHGKMDIDPEVMEEADACDWDSPFMVVDEHGNTVEENVKIVW